MWSIFRLLLVTKTYRKSVPSTGIRWQWQQVFPKTEPGPKATALLVTFFPSL